jgi:hypothetical protein
MQLGTFDCEKKRKITGVQFLTHANITLYFYKQ